MKKSILLFTLLCVSVLATPFANAFSASGDTPYAEGGDGFMSGDDCGFVMGTSSTYNNGTMYFTSVEPDRDQGCVDENGYFYKSSSRNSYSTFTKSGGLSSVSVNYRWSSTSSLNTVVDQTTGYWSGYARMTHSSLPSTQRLLWFDWTCPASSSCYGLDTGKYHVQTDLETGAISGYAWNDYFGFVSFSSLTAELPPRQIMTYIDILANETDMGPEDVDYTNAPLADGYEFWRIRVQFYDQATGQFLDESDIDDLTITEYATSDSNVYLNQVENSGNAIDTGYASAYEGCTDDTVYCAMTEDDGSTSFNRFIFSGGPTSNVLGLNDDTDTAIEYYSDRDGCRWIYYSQWAEVDGASVQKKCPYPSGSIYDKADVFYDRQDARNKYEIDYIMLDVTFSGSRDLEMYEWDDTATGGSAFQEVSLAAGSYWAYVPATDGGDLSYRPRYQIENFVSVYDSAEHTDISDIPSKTMYLVTEATVSDTSDAYQAVYSGSASRPGYRVYYQMDATSDGSDQMLGDMYLLIDTDEPQSGKTSGDVEETYRTDSISSGYLSTEYFREYAIGYGQKFSECGGVIACPASTNTLSDPTAEQWVCDDATEQRFGEESCYYTEYLPHIDRHAEPEDMLVIGAINSVVDEDDFLNEDYVSVLGTAETINLRNKMYAQVARYTLGQTASGGTLDSSMDPDSGIVELIGGRLLFAQGDVTIEGSSSFSDKTLVVVGGDVFIDGDITGGRLGIIAFRSGGVGGNVWVHYDVNNLYTNMFLDGSLFSYDGTQPPAEEYPTWWSDEVRLESLKNQLYLKGSVISRNTVNGTDSLDKGDGTTAATTGISREYDLNKLRQYRLCYELDTDGSLLSTTEECNEGETLSEYGTANGVYNSFIIEYAPASDLPIFSVESGLFN